MTRTLAGILALLIATAGWYYLFYSQAARRLSGIEPTRQNRLRSTFRRIGGVMMLALALSIFAAVYIQDPDRPTPASLLLWLVIFLLMLVIVMLGIVDVVFTLRLRRQHKERR